MKTFDEICEDAATRYPEKIYRYRPVEPKNLKKLLLKNTIYLSSPNDFNDPFDCKFCINDNGTSLQKRRKFSMITQKRNPSWGKLKVRREVNKWMAAGRHEGVANRKDYTAVMDRMGILCMSERNDNILMWGHYAEEHKGVCLEFSPNFEDPLFKQIYPVHYENELPVLNIFDLDYSESILRSILTKWKEWSYEEEWRIWLENGGPGIYEINPDRLTGLIFGCKAEKKFISKVEAINAKRKTPVTLYKASRSKTKFSLEIDFI